jgi:serine/threonine protein kinase
VGCPRCGRENPSDSRYCAGCGSALAAPVDAREADPLIGRVIDRAYRIDRAIARGGMGVVYVGTNTRLEQAVAIKVLGAHYMAQPAIEARFRQEARTQARLRHPGIVAVTDFISDGGLSAIVMEYAPGDTLAALIAKWGALPIDRLRSIFVPVLEALEYAHGQGITHRDIKPSNILIVYVASKEIPKLADFGIAKAAEGGERLTATGAVMGTLEYMAPEQCASTRDADHRADIYSLGITLFEAATGRVPFRSTNPAELISSHLSEPPLDPRAIRAEIPAPLAELVLRALEKRPEDRFQSAADMLRALLAIGERIPEITVPTPIPAHVIPHTTMSPVPELDPNLPVTAPSAPIAAVTPGPQAMTAFGRPSRSFAEPAPAAKSRLPFAIAPVVTVALVVVLLGCALVFRTVATWIGERREAQRIESENRF